LNTREENKYGKTEYLICPLRELGNALLWTETVIETKAHLEKDFLLSHFCDELPLLSYIQGYAGEFDPLNKVKTAQDSIFLCVCVLAMVLEEGKNGWPLLTAESLVAKATDV